MKSKNKNHNRVSLYLPSDIHELIETKRLDIPRSKFIQRIIEQHMILDKRTG